MNTVSKRVINVSGYIMVDCLGLDLVRDDGKTITGLYSLLQRAILTGKTILANNCNWDGHYISGIPGLGIQLTSSIVTFTSATLQIAITSSDVVTITNFGVDPNT